MMKGSVFWGSLLVVVVDGMIVGWGVYIFALMDRCFDQREGPVGPLVLGCFGHLALLEIEEKCGGLGAEEIIIPSQKPATVSILSPRVT
jgi:hypothetical protein